MSVSTSPIAPNARLRTTPAVGHDPSLAKLTPRERAALALGGGHSVSTWAQLLADADLWVRCIARQRFAWEVDQRRSWR